MLIEHPLSVRTIHAELLQQCLDDADDERVPSVRPPVPVTKQIGGDLYWYAQYTDLSGTRRQDYIGPDDDAAVRARVDELRANAGLDENAHRVGMVKALKSVGYYAPDRFAADAIQIMAARRGFRSGLVLVGTPAFGGCLNMLGWADRPVVQTNDVDVGIDNRAVSLVIPEEGLSLSAALEAWNDRLFQVPALHRKDPSTSLKMRGKDFHIDFLVPGKTGEERPVPIAGLGIHAHPLPFLDYLVKDAQWSPMLTRTGTLVRLPHPARFLWHKCAVAALRPAAWEDKRQKDMHQAHTLFQLLRESREDDLLEAWDMATDCMEPDAFIQAMEKGLSDKKMQDIRDWVAEQGPRTTFLQETEKEKPIENSDSLLRQD